MKLAMKSARALCCGIGPMFARNTLKLSPFSASKASVRRRMASYCSVQRCGRMGSTEKAPSPFRPSAARSSPSVAPAEAASAALETVPDAAAPSSALSTAPPSRPARNRRSASARSARCALRSGSANSGRGSAGLGYMLVPTARSARCASLLKRCCSTDWMSRWMTPSRTLFRNPPAASILWSSSQAFRASSSVSFSTYQEPPAGSSGWSRLNSFCSSTCALRATRRENSEPGRSASSKHPTVRPSTPPTTPEKASVVLRSMFT